MSCDLETALRGPFAFFRMYVGLKFCMALDLVLSGRLTGAEPLVRCEKTGL